MLIIITFLIPNLCKKKGIVRIKRVSEICEMESNKMGCFTPNVPGCVVAKLSRNDPPKALVICYAAPKNIANTKNINIFLCLNNTKASSPNVFRNDFALFDFIGGQAGIVNA